MSSIPSVFRSTLYFALLYIIFWITLGSVTARAHNLSSFWMILLWGRHISPCFSPACICFFSFTLLCITGVRDEHRLFVLILCRLILYMLFFVSYILQMTVQWLCAIKYRFINTTSHRVVRNLYFYIWCVLYRPVHDLLLEFFCFTNHWIVIWFPRLRVIFRISKWFTHLFLLALLWRPCGILWHHFFPSLCLTLDPIWLTTLKSIQFIVVWVFLSLLLLHIIVFIWAYYYTCLDAYCLFWSLSSLNFSVMSFATLADYLLCVWEIIILTWLLIADNWVKVSLLCKHIQIVE